MVAKDNDKKPGKIYIVVYFVRMAKEQIIKIWQISYLNGRCYVFERVKKGRKQR